MRRGPHDPLALKIGGRIAAATGVLAAAFIPACTVYEIATMPKETFTGFPDDMAQWKDGDHEVENLIRLEDGKPNGEKYHCTVTAEHESFELNFHMRGCYQVR
jgi:hypothetical protein